MDCQLSDDEGEFGMHCLFRVTVLVAIGLLIIAANPALGKGLEDSEWIEVRTPNFRVRSVLSEKKSIELARQLELFRAAVSAVTNISRTESPIPTEIYLLRGEKDFSLLGIGPNVAGIFRAGLRNNLIVVRNTHGMEETSIIMHEYVHFLIRNHGSLHYPKWYDEGFAEYFASARTRFGKFEIGAFPKHRRASLSRLPWVPLRKILAPEDYDEWTRKNRSMFYAESWALVHFLKNRPERGALFGQDMARYVELIESGSGEVAAFEEAFSITAEDLNFQVKRYVERRRLPGLRMSVEQLLPDFNPDVISLSREQISLALGQTAFQGGELESAKHWFTIAAANDHTRPQAEAGLGKVLRSGDDFEAAQARFERAVALAPNDPYIQVDVAGYWRARADSTEDAAERAVYLTRAREHYVTAWKLDDSMPETFAGYASTFVMEGQRYDFAIELLKEAEHALPSSLTVRLLLAEAYMGADRSEDAVTAARSVWAWSHDESDEATRAREVLTKLTSETK